jgi:hypothetical protein
MKKILLIFLCSIITTTRLFAQQNGCLKQMFLDNYENAFNWGTNIRNFITSSVSCYNPLPPSGTQGTISVSGGRVNFTKVTGGHENRIVRSLGTIVDKNFELKFELNVQQESGTGCFFFPAVLTSHSNPEPTYITPITACNNYSIMDEIAISCGSATNNTNLQLGIQLLDNGTRTFYQGIPINYNSIVYVSLKIYGNAMGTLYAYSDPARTVLINQISFSIPSTINNLAYLQHSIASGGGSTRVSTAWVDNVQICEIARQCCQANLVGEKAICNAVDTIKANQQYTLNGSVEKPGFKVLPSDVSYTSDGNNLVINNWGPIISAPKMVKIIDTFICEGNVVYDTNLLYVYPKVDASFSITGLGSNGNLITSFTAQGIGGPIGTVHQWDIKEWDPVTNTDITPKGIRNTIWLVANSTGIPPVSFIALGSAAGTPWPSANNYSGVITNSQYPNGCFPDLVLGKFYSIGHIIYFDNGLCPYVGKRNIIYITNNMIKQLGDPGDAKYKTELKTIDLKIKTIKIKG